MKQAPYFYAFFDEMPPEMPSFSKQDRLFWHIFAGATIGFGLWYIHWRWTASLNPDALVFSILVAACETAAFIGTILFVFDISCMLNFVGNPPTNEIYKPTKILQLLKLKSKSTCKHSKNGGCWQVLEFELSSKLICCLCPSLRRLFD